MIVSLNNVLKGETQYQVSYQTSWWVREDEYDPVIGLSRPIGVQVDIQPLGTRFLLRGRIVTELILQCDRCLEEFLCPMDQEFSLILRKADPVFEIDKELKREELLEEVIKEDELDLEPIIREQIYLFLPMKCLCKADCKGICPNCGRNLNKEACLCKAEIVHPAFQALKRLKGGKI